MTGMTDEDKFRDMYRKLARAVLRESSEDGNPFEHLRDSLKAINKGRPDPHDYDEEAQYSLAWDGARFPDDDED